MEQFNFWVTLSGVVIIPFVVWLFNMLITKKIDALESNQEKDKELFFARLDAIKDAYVRKDMYDQAMQFHQKETDSKFNNLVESMNKQFENVEGKIDDVKDLINEKFNGNKNGQK